MTSFNHYAYGSVGAWLYRTLAGIAPGEPGYRLIDFAPRPGGGLTWAKAEIDTPSGPAAIEWRSGCRELLIQITIPPGSRGRFSGPPGWLGGSEEMGSGSHEFRLESSEPTA
jgi:alpha-L-rhamnosidase